MVAWENNKLQYPFTTLFFRSRSESQLFATKIMEIAIGTALISTILEPMAAKAMEKVKAMVVNKVDGIVNIEREISNLQTTLSMIQDIVQVAEEKQIDKQGKPTVFIQNWLHDLVDIGYEARNVLEDFNASSSIITSEEASKPVKYISSLVLSCFCGSSSDTSIIPVAILNRLEKDIRSVRERFYEKKKEGETFAILKSVVGEGSKSVRVEPRPEVGPFINKQRDGLFLGREHVKEGIMEKLLHPSDNCVHVVAIWGMGGIGKTTLAQSIYNDERVKEDDYPSKNRRWLCVGVNKFSADKVIREIVNDQNTIGIGNLQTKLQKELRGDRFLIVLDDVWDVDGSEWDLLFNPLTEVGKGGLIIITRRQRMVCTAITIQTAYNLQPLSEEDSWSIFENCAFMDGKTDTTPDLKRIGEEIVKKLNGLPLALKVVGRSLLNKDSSTWTNFLEFNEWKLRNDNEVMSALRWSYNHLPRHLKMCFSYCSLFPKDHVLDKKVLVEMWMAHDLIQKEEQERPEDVGAQYFKELVNASLLQCVDGKYTMHDLIHDLALLVSNGEFASANSTLTNDQMEKVRHITITPGDYSKIPRLCKIEKLLTLYTISSGKKYTKCLGDLDGVFKQMKSIRVMVLSSYGIYEIPDCISELKHLRYLDVTATSVKSLPHIVCKLHNLQMLAAPLSAVLPKEIVNMVNLRHVRAKLSTCKGVGKLTSLQELSSIHVCEGDNIRELGDMQRLRGKFTIRGLGNVEKLEDDVGSLMDKQTLMDGLVLQLEKSTISEEVLDALGCPPNLTYLKIYGDTAVVKFPRWMVDTKQKFDKLQTLKLSGFRKLEFLPPLGELASLKHLSLIGVEVKRLGDEFYGKFTDGKVFFPSLESLDFLYMNEWEEWDDIIIENSGVSFFPSLTSLKIKQCAKLVLVLPVVKNRTSIMNAANFMTSLSRLEICYCAGLKRLQLDALVSLKELQVILCSSLVQITSAICEDLNIQSCRLLEKIDVARCDSLVVIRTLNLCSCESLRSLRINTHGLDSLEHLGIFRCPTLELPFEDGSSSSSRNSVAVPILDIRTDNMQVFRTLLHHELVSLEFLLIENLGGFENFDETEANNFCKSRSLKHLVIQKCEDLSSLPADFHKLSSLKRLEIQDCPQLQSLPPDFHKLSSLEILSIDQCPQLQSLPPDFHKLSSLEILSINQCPQLQSLPLEFHKLSSLKSLSIHKCPQLQSLPPDFHKLSSFEELRINHCPQLQSLPPEFHKLSSLKSLSIHKCPQLQSLPPDFHKLSSLKNLSIDNCPQLQSLPPEFHKLSSLKSLSIHKCPQLQSLPPDFHKLSSLEELRINHSPQLQSLPPDFHKLSSLEILEIQDCPLQSLLPDFHKLSSLESLSIRQYPQLQSLPPDFHKLSSLKRLSIHQCPQLQSLPPDFHKLSSLESLSIDQCPQLQSLPPDFHKLTSLDQLIIRHCPQLQSLPADGFAPSLNYLKIYDCPLLYERCKDKSGLDWHKINHILREIGA